MTMDRGRGLDTVVEGEEDSQMGRVVSCFVHLFLLSVGIKSFIGSSLSTDISS